MPKIDVSFKNTEKELNLYDYIQKLENQEKSEFVKKAVDFYIKYLNSKNK